MKRPVVRRPSVGRERSFASPDRAKPTLPGKPAAARPYTAIKTAFPRAGLAAAVLIFAPAANIPHARADQAECEASVRVIMAPYGNNAPTEFANRFGTSVTKIGNTETRGYSLQTVQGSLYYDEQMRPVSLSFVNGDVYTTADEGKTWQLVNSTAPEIMDQVKAGILSQAEKATDIVCEFDVELAGRTVHHYAADYVLYNTGQPARSEYWVDGETGFVWRDVTLFRGDPEILITVDAEPAPDMSLPDPKG